RANGVLFALTAPTGGIISGKSAILNLDGWTYEEMSLKDEASMQINWPSQFISPRQRARMDEKEINETKKRQAKNLQLLRKTFEDARLYHAAINSKNSTQAYDSRLNAMGSVLDGSLPVMVRADRASDIQSAIAFAVEQKIKMIILGGYDAVKCDNLLKKYDIPVIVSATHRTPRRRGDAYDAAYSLPERLRKSGIRFCISSTDKSETWNTRTLPYHAAMAVGFGLPKEEALKAVTLYPAQILGVDDRIGSLEIGKDASLIVTTGDPLETTTQTEMAFIEGRKVDLSNRHLRLYKKYQQKYRQLGKSK
ncbi:MAG: amidohydrolase family protein, partial [Planctomycetota bacterium]